MDHARAPDVVQINGTALRAIRELSGVSCRALSAVAGVDVSFLARIERGEKRGLRREAWERISFHLDIDGRAVLAAPCDHVSRRTSVPKQHHRGTVVVPLSA